MGVAGASGWSDAGSVLRSNSGFCCSNRSDFLFCSLVGRWESRSCASWEERRFLRVFCGLLTFGVEVFEVLEDVEALVFFGTGKDFGWWSLLPYPCRFFQVQSYVLWVAYASLGAVLGLESRFYQASISNLRFLEFLGIYHS